MRCRRRRPCSVRFDRISRDGTDDILMLIEYNVDNVVDAEYSPGLLNVLTDRVAVELSCMRFRADHHAVVALNGFAGGNAGHDTLCAAGIPCKVMILNVGKADHAVCFGYGTENIHRCPGIRRTKVYTVIRIGIHTAQFFPPSFTGQMALLLRGVAAMAAQCEDKRYILSFYVRSIEAIEQRRQNLPRRTGASNI